MKLDSEELDLLGEITVSSDAWAYYDQPFFIVNNLKTDYEQVCNRWGNKIMGIKIEYSKGLWVRNITLQKQ